MYIKAFQSLDFGEMKVMMIDGRVHFPATEAARTLGYKDPKMAIAAHCKVTIYTVGTEVIDAKNLYQLIVNSPSPRAAKFESWVFDEVLPQAWIDRALEDPDWAIQRLTEYKEAKTLLDRVPPSIECPHCGEGATVNAHVDQERRVGYFYECCCGRIIDRGE